MWRLDSLGIPLQITDSSVTAPLWLGAVLAGLLLILMLLALFRAGAASTLAFMALVGFGAWFAWTWYEYERTGERRTVEARLGVLDAQAIVPNSPLACLDGANIEALDQACERALFASAESSAAALAFTAARLSALADGVGEARRRGQPPSAGVQRLQTNLEQDRYGAVAATLASRGCTAERCESFGLFRDAGKVQANLRNATFNANVGRYSANWASRSGRTAVAIAASSATTPTAAPTTPAQTGARLPTGYTLPSPDSIPAVSIMDPEPSAPERRSAPSEPRPRARTASAAPAAAAVPTAPPASAASPAPSPKPMNGSLITPASPGPNFTPVPSGSGPAGLY